jgi:imidazolonepropionase-like amidohydrolase
MSGSWPVLTVLLGSTIFPVVGALFGQTPYSTNGDLALVRGTIYVSPTEQPIRDGVVLIRAGKIVAVGSSAVVQIPQTAQLIDCSRLTITAGFWNSHVHFTERKWANAGEIPAPELGRQLQEMLTRYGFTSVFDLSSLWKNTRSLRNRIESGEVPGPRIRSTGEGLVPKGALPSETVVNMMGWMNVPVPEITDAAETAAASKKLLDDGVDGIKLFRSSPRSPSLPDNALQAAVNEAHRAGKPVFLHPDRSEDILAAVRSGVDVIAHTTPHSGPWDETILTAMKERKVALIPTLTIWKYYMRHDRISAQEQVANTEVGQVRAWVAAGGTVLFGNDLGAIDYDPTEEYALMTEAGMSFSQILASLTTAPAERFGEAKQLGRIASGLEADLVVLKEDPSKNIRALADVKYTLRSGKIIFRARE